MAAALLLCAHAGAEELLEADVAFRSSARLAGPGLIEVRYDTAPGYYLYRDRLAFSVEPPAALGKPILPKGEVKVAEFFGKSVIYRNRTVVKIPLSGRNAQTVTLTADLQGCADIGVCYPPVRRTYALALTGR